jgi:hypothetical protein
VHERLAAEDAEEGVAVLLRIEDRAVERGEIDGVLRLDVDPATLAAEIAGVENREVEERREVFAAFDAALEFLDGEKALEAEIPRKLPDAPGVG